MIHVLVHENRSRSRLSLLLRELGQTASFYGDVESLLSAAPDDGDEARLVLFDVHSKTMDGVESFGAMKERWGDRNLIGFEELDANSSERKQERPDGLKHYLLLPPQAERAKSRLKATLAQCRRSGDGTANGRNIGTKGFRRAFSPRSVPRSFPRNAAPAPLSGTEIPFRYLTAQSRRSREFGQKLLNSLSFETLLVLSGESGAEFVLAAREMQYQLHGDAESLGILPAENVTLELLHFLEKQAKIDGQQRLCFLESFEDAPPEAAMALQVFVQNIENMRDPHLRIIVRWEENADYLHRETERILSSVCDKRLWLRIPSLSERREDIRPIAVGFLSALTCAHPFLTVKEIEPTALQYLEGAGESFSYQGLLQALRNAVALGKGRVLTAETIRDFRTNDITSEHLVESMADEAYFPQ